MTFGNGDITIFPSVVVKYVPFPGTCTERRLPDRNLEFSEENRGARLIWLVI